MGELNGRRTTVKRKTGNETRVIIKEGESSEMDMPAAGRFSGGIREA